MKNGRSLVAFLLVNGALEKWVLRMHCLEQKSLCIGKALLQIL